MPVTASLSRAQIVSLLGNDPIDLNGGVGTILVAQRTDGAALSNGGTVAGSTLRRVKLDGTTTDNVADSSLPGTWRNLGGTVNTYSGSNAPCSTFQRIA